MRTYITRYQYGMLVGSGLDEAKLAEVGVHVSKDRSGDRLTPGEVEHMEQAVGYYGATGYPIDCLREDYAFADGLSDETVGQVAWDAALKLGEGVNELELWRTCLEEAIVEAGFATTRAGDGGEEEEAA